MLQKGGLSPRPYRLINPVQNYAWGARGQQALIPRLLGIEPAEDQSYAELWIGAHPKAPSRVKYDHNQIFLNQLIARYPQAILGQKVMRRFDKRLPFLLKILAAAEALSIQAHPNHKQAQQLHHQDPGHYPDTQHKPEVAIALDHLKALVGFKPWPEIVANLKQYPEILAYIRPTRDPGLSAEMDKAAADQQLKHLYTTMLKKTGSDPQGMADLLIRLTHKIKGKSEPTETEQLFLQLRKQYRTDVGLLSLFFMNVIHLKTGEAIFLQPGLPHAYLEGNIVECMANSDNVVRAGLTPKFKDLDALAQILVYKTGQNPRITAETCGDERIFTVPVDEFQLIEGHYQKGSRKIKPTHGKVEILLVLQGQIQIVNKKDSRMHLGIGKGQAAIIPALIDSYLLDVQADTHLFRVEVPI